MKINFIVRNHNLSGGNRVIAIYADKLARRGHDVSVIVGRRAAPTFREFARSLVKERKWPSRPNRDATYFENTKANLLVFENDRPVTDRDVPDGDIVIATWWETAEWVSDLNQNKGKKCQFIQGYEIYPGASVDRIDATWRMPFHKIVVSNWLTNIAREKFGIQSVAVVPNGVDLSLFHGPERSRRAHPTVGFMHSDAAFKGTDIALKAIETAHRKIPDLHVVAFGHRDPAPDLPMPDNSNFYRNPRQEELKNIYSGCDAWLFSSRAEGFGLPILEAMACRNPVIATPAGASPELISVDNGVLLRDADAIEMADAIEAFFRMDEGKWQSMSNAAYRTAEAYTWDDATDKFEAALQAILKT